MSRLNIGIHRDVLIRGLRRLRAPLVAALVAAPLSAAAQPRPPAKGAPPPPPAEMPNAPHVDETLITTTPNGLTSEQAAKRAMSTSVITKSAEATAAGADVRANVTSLAYIPDLTLLASYTRLSTVTPPIVGGGATRSVITTDPAGTANPATVAAQPTQFPVFFDLYLLQASLRVPISDYLLKINHVHTAATQSAEAARFDVIAARAVASASAKQAYFEWLRARGAIAVAERTLATAQAHAADSKTKFAAGAVAGADVLRAEAAVASAELLVERATNAATTFEWSLRTLIHAEAEEALAPGESLEGNLPPLNEELRALLAEANTTRAEIKSIERSAAAAHRRASAARAGRWPTLTGVADLVYANPNSRKFPTTNDFFPSWAVGAQLTWSPKSFVAGGADADIEESQASSLEAQRAATRDSVTREVVTAYTAVRTADAAIGTTTRQLDSEREAYRVSTTLYTAGRTTGSALLDAQNALAQARFDNLNARTDARVARVQLEHAVGRDTRGMVP